MKLLWRSLLLTASLVSTPIAVESAAIEVADSPEIDDQEEVILQILELRQQIEDLLGALPPEVRREVERRWQERQPVTEAEPAERVVTTAPVVDKTHAPLPSEETSPEDPETPADEIAESSLPCGGFHLLDTNGDGLVSGGDRQWRFLRLWFDNGDANLEETELESLFELGVRQIDVSLRFYTNEDGDSEDVDAGELIELVQVGTGNSPRRTGALVINADRLTRDEVLTISGPDGDPLSGFQPLSAESFLASETLDRIPVICPDLD